MSTTPIPVHPRFPLATTVMVREATNDSTILAQLRNISLSGCYLETPRQIAEGTRIRVVLQASRLRADIWGVVRRRDASGVGVQFTNGSTIEDWKRLESLIEQLRSDSSRSASATAST